MATESVTTEVNDQAPTLEARVNSAICTLLDAHGICRLLDDSEVMSPIEFPNSVRAAMNCIQRQVIEALRALEGEEA